LEQRLKLVPGVVECGLFIGIADVMVIGWLDRVEIRQRPASVSVDELPR
jgi:ribose 5-phosphate isomerase